MGVRVEIVADRDGARQATDSQKYDHFLGYRKPGFDKESRFLPSVFRNQADDQTHGRTATYQAIAARDASLFVDSAFRPAALQPFGAAGTVAHPRRNEKSSIASDQRRVARRNFTAGDKVHTALFTPNGRAAVA